MMTMLEPSPAISAASNDAMEPLLMPPSVNSMPVVNKLPVNGIAFPSPSVTCRFRPAAVVGTMYSAGTTSWITRLNPCAPPLFSTAIANLTRSPASASTRLLSIGSAFKFVLVIPPPNAGPAAPGAAKATGPTVEPSNVGETASVATTPFERTNSGAAIVTGASADEFTSPLFVDPYSASTWFCRTSPSAINTSCPVSVNRMSMVEGALGSTSNEPKSN